MMLATLSTLALRRPATIRFDTCSDMSPKAQVMTGRTVAVNRCETQARAAAGGIRMTEWLACARAIRSADGRMEANYMKAKPVDLPSGLCEALYRQINLIDAKESSS